MRRPTLEAAVVATREEAAVVVATPEEPAVVATPEEEAGATSEEEATSRAAGTPWAVATRAAGIWAAAVTLLPGDRKSTRLNSSHQLISDAVFCLKKKKTNDS